MSTGTLPDDNDLKRNRTGRYAVLAGTAVALPVIGFATARGLVGAFTGMMENNNLPVQIGGIIGLGAGVLGFLALKHLFYVTNSSTGIMLTRDALKAFLSQPDVWVPYGPGGPFVAYPWEGRVKENNISIKTATNEFTFTIQCQDGTVNGKGSFRLRPDHEQPRRFQTGAAAMANDLKDLILGYLISQIGPMKIADVLLGIATINGNLQAEFKGIDPNVKTPFEDEHGVYVVDVTLSSLLPSAEVQRTMSGITEAGFIAEGTRILLGFTSQKSMQLALNSKKVSRADYNNARDRFMAVSGNMDGVNVTRYEIDLNASGVEKETAEALMNLLRNTPPGILAGIAKQPAKGAKK